MLIFFAIICLCGVILWVKGSQDSSPFLVSIRPDGERWDIVEHTNHKTEIPVYYVLQEALINQFATRWFTISDDTLVNQAVWSGECSRDSMECKEQNDRIATCSIYCTSSDSVFQSFTDVVLPVYNRLEAEQGAVWTVRKIYDIKPVDTITEAGGLWQLNVIVKTNTGNAQFTGYALVAHAPDKYHQNMGYYIADFNTYRIR